MGRFCVHLQCPALRVADRLISCLESLIGGYVIPWNCTSVSVHGHKTGFTDVRFSRFSRISKNGSSCSWVWAIPFFRVYVVLYISFEGLLRPRRCRSCCRAAHRAADGVSPFRRPSLTSLRLMALRAPLAPEESLGHASSLHRAWPTVEFTGQAVPDQSAGHHPPSNPFLMH